jgi:hypothetical protein
MKILGLGVWIMKTRIILFLLTLIFSSTLLATYPDKTFTSSGQIVDGEYWNYVKIYGDTTVVNMTGGYVAEGIFSHDASILNVIGGDASIEASGTSTVNISNGNLHHGVNSDDHATVNFSGNAIIDGLTVAGFSHTIVTGGSIRYSIAAIGNGAVDLYKCNITRGMGAIDSSTINVYGNNLEKFASGGTYNVGYVTGNWLDGEHFKIDFVENPDTYNHINLIPEPITFFLLCGGGLVLFRRGRRQNI